MILQGGRDLSERADKKQSNESQAAGPMPDDSLVPTSTIFPRKTLQL